jgi:hypothetical protein
MSVISEAYHLPFYLVIQAAKLGRMLFDSTKEIKP